VPGAFFEPLGLPLGFLAGGSATGGTGESSLGPSRMSSSLSIGAAALPLPLPRPLPAPAVPPPREPLPLPRGMALGHKPTAKLSNLFGALEAESADLSLTLR